MSLRRLGEFTILILLVIVISQGQAGRKIAEYGEKCTTGNVRSSGKDSVDLVLCNSKANLACNVGLCVCADWSFHDNGTETCKSNVGGKCVAKDDCGPNTGCEKYRKYEKSVFGVRLPSSIEKKLERVTRVSADEDEAPPSACACLQGFAPDELRRGCKRILQFQEACSAKLKRSGLECDASIGLECDSESICTCKDKEGTYYDKNMKKCVVRTGERCTKTSQCEEGTICSSLNEYLKVVFAIRLGERIRDFLKANSSSDQRCVCPIGYALNKDGKCLGIFGTECSEASHCNVDRFLTCVDGVCQCEKGTTESFVEGNGNGTCQLTVGSACNSKKGPACVEESTCTNGQCQVNCPEGFSETPYGACLLSHGGTCKVPSPKPCNVFQGLACIGTECSCFDSSLKWNSKQNACVAKQGSRCGNFKIPKGDTSDGGRTGTPSHEWDPTGGAELYVAGCELGLTCTKDERNKVGICKKTGK